MTGTTRLYYRELVQVDTAGGGKHAGTDQTLNSGQVSEPEDYYCSTDKDRKRHKLPFIQELPENDIYYCQQ